MTPKELSTAVKKIIKMNKADYTVKGVYFNPISIDDLYSQVLDLEDAGFSISTTETETEEGTLVSSSIISKDRKLSLGSVLLDGEDIIVEQSLETVKHVLKFIEQEANEEPEKTKKSIED